jgi:tetratricopeptide (TPR) repeat protein
LGQQEQAISDLNRCIDLKPDYANAYFARGATFGRMGRLDEAIADFSATLQLEPTHKQAIFNRGATYAIMRRHDLAVLDLQLALKAMPGNADGWLFLGRSQLALQNNAAACASFQKASALNSPKAADLIAKHCVSK